MLIGFLKKFRQRALKAEQDQIFKTLDIGAGSNVRLANLDGMFPRLIHIGRDCIFAPNSIVLAHDASYYPFTGEYRVAPVWMGDKVFVGYGAVIMPGVRIGSNVVIGAGSVVTKDVPGDSVVAGAPAKVICSLADYLAKRTKHPMLTPPYAGKTPGEVTWADVEAFRTVAYEKFAKDGAV